MILGRGKSSFIWVMLIYCLGVPALSSLYLTSFIINNEASVSNFTTNEWISIYSVSAITMALAITPSTFIALCSGYFLGWQGLYLFIPSYLIASIIAFVLTGFINYSFVISYIAQKPKANTFVNSLKDRENMFIFMGRLSPVLPFALMNLVFRALKVNFYRFVIIGGLGMLPRSILALWTGTQIKSILDHSFWSSSHPWSKIITIGMVILTFFFFIKLFTKKAISR